MKTEIAMILSAGVVAAMSLLTLLITKMFDAHSEKRKEREKFFYKVFPKRLELYEEIIRAVEFIPAKEEIAILETPEKLDNFFSKISNTLISLGVRCVIYGSRNVLNSMNCIMEFLELYRKMMGNPLKLNPEELRVIATNIARAKTELAFLIRKEVGTNFVEYTMTDFLRKLKKKHCFPKDYADEK